MGTYIGILLILISGIAPSLCKHRVARNGGNYGGEGDYSGGDYSAIPGNPGQDYPTYGPYPPTTSFQCNQQQWVPGYYADTQFNCQVYHVCESSGKDNVFLCPNGTIFNQQYFVCDWWYNVDCAQSTNWYSLNGNLYSGQSGNYAAGSGTYGDTGYGSRTDTGSAQAYY